MYLQTHHMSIYLGSSNPPSLLFDLSKEMKSPQIHHLLISQRRWRALKSTILIPPRSCRALKSTTCPFKTIQSALVYVPSNPPHVHLSWVFKPTNEGPSYPLSILFEGDEEPSNPPFWYLSKEIVEPSNPPFWYLQGTVEPSNPPPVHLKLFKVLGSMYLQTHHMSIYLGSSNPPSLLFDLSKEMKSPQIHHLSILISQRRWRALKFTIFKPTISPFLSLKIFLGLQTHHLSFLISQRRWRALKSTIWSLKGDEEPSNPPFQYLQGAVKPSNPPLVHLKLFKVLGSMYLQIHHMSIYLGPSNPPMKSPRIHYLSILISQRRWRALKSTILILSKETVEPSNPPFWYLQGAVEPSNPPLVHLKAIQSAWVYVPSNPPHVHLSWVFKPTISPFLSLKGDEEPSNRPFVHFDLSKEIKSPQIHHFDTSKEL